MDASPGHDRMDADEESQSRVSIKRKYHLTLTKKSYMPNHRCRMCNRGTSRRYNPDLYKLKKVFQDKRRTPERALAVSSIWLCTDFDTADLMHEWKEVNHIDLCRSILYIYIIYIYM